MKVDDPEKIKFLGLRETLEKCSNHDGGTSQVDEMKSQVESFLNYMDEALDDVKINNELDDDYTAGLDQMKGPRRVTMPIK